MAMGQTPQNLPVWTDMKLRLFLNLKDKTKEKRTSWHLDSETGRGDGGSRSQLDISVVFISVLCGSAVPGSATLAVPHLFPRSFGFSLVFLS